MLLVEFFSLVLERENGEIIFGVSECFRVFKILSKRMILRRRIYIIYKRKEGGVWGFSYA